AFASGNLAAAQAVVTNRHAAGPAQVFALDRLVLVVPAANKAGIKTPFDVAKSGARIAAASADSPLTALTTDIVAQLAGQPGAPAGFAAAVTANTKPGGVDPRTVVAAVESGAADAAFVYRSDMYASTTLTTINLPDAVA